MVAPTCNPSTQEADAGGSGRRFKKGPDLRVAALHTLGRTVHLGDTKKKWLWKRKPRECGNEGPRRRSALLDAAE